MMVRVSLSGPFLRFRFRVTEKRGDKKAGPKARLFDYRKDKAQTTPTKSQAASAAMASIIDHIALTLSRITTPQGLLKPAYLYLNHILEWLGP